MKFKIFFLFFITNLSCLSLYDSALYFVCDSFKLRNQFFSDLNYYSFLENIFLFDLYSPLRFGNDIKREEIIALTILVNSILCKMFLENNKDYEYLKKIFLMTIEKVKKKEPYSKNYFAVLLINEACFIFDSIKGYSDYVRLVAPDWANNQTYFEDGVEYSGPNFKKEIPVKNRRFINENLFGSIYFVFICSLSQFIHNLFEI